MLYLIATPIGNLADLSFRAVEVMKACDYLLCEDTRHSRRLLDHYDIHRPLKSYHKFNEAASEGRILADLEEGLSIGLLSDAGTPSIADPGLRLVRKCRELGLPVTALPGPCAAILGLILSGLDTEVFQFLGFLPRTSGRLETMLNRALDYPGTTVCYETPHRLLKTLVLLEKIAPDVSLSVCRELTKKFEEVQSGTPTALRLHYTARPPKGEIVLVIRNL